MSETAERNQWYRGKRPLILEYRRGQTMMAGAIAARGFDTIPGHLFDMQTEHELDLKLKLSDLNYQIMDEAMRRDLRSQESAYAIAFKEAQIAWELEKAGLLTDLQNEFAAIENSKAITMEELEISMIEAQLRSLGLITAKAAIEIEIERIRQEIANVELSTLPYEEQLANEQLLTAQRKLALIPYLEQIIAQEQILITKKKDVINKESSLIDAREGLIPKKEQLISANEKEVAALDRLADAIAEKIRNEFLKAGKRVALEKLQGDGLKVDKALLELDKLIEEARAELRDAQHARDMARIENEITEIETQTDNVIRMTTLEDQANDSFILDKTRESTARLTQQVEDNQNRVRELVVDSIESVQQAVTLTQQDVQYMAAETSQQVQFIQTDTQNDVSVIETATKNQIRLIKEGTDKQVEYIEGQAALEADYIQESSEITVEHEQATTEIRTESMREVSGIDLSHRETYTTQEADYRAANIINIADKHADAEEDAADIKAAAQVTTKLFHTLYG